MQLSVINSQRLASEPRTRSTHKSRAYRTYFGHYADRENRQTLVDKTKSQTEELQALRKENTKLRAEVDKLTVKVASNASVISAAYRILHAAHDQDSL